MEFSHLNYRDRLRNALAICRAYVARYPDRPVFVRPIEKAIVDIEAEIATLYQS